MPSNMIMLARNKHHVRGSTTMNTLGRLVFKKFGEVGVPLSLALREKVDGLEYADEDSVQSDIQKLMFCINVRERLRMQHP